MKTQQHAANPSRPPQHCHSPRPLHVLALSVALGAAVSSCSTPSPHNGGFKVESKPDRLIISHNSHPVAHYVFADPEILRPYFAHIRTPDGIQVTRNHPPIPDVDRTDHATMHPGIWLAFGDISGQDFWRNKATIRHDGFVTPPEVNDRRLFFQTTSTLIDTNGQELAKLNQSYFLLSTGTSHYSLGWKADFTPLVDEFAFGDQEEMGFGIRVATPISERVGGLVKNGDGLVGAKNTWGKTAPWCDYSGVISNRLVGITVIPHSSNFRPSWFHSRDYGLIVANPFGQRAFTKGEPSRVPIKRGVTFTLKFAALVHSSPTNEPPDLDSICQTLMGQN